MEAKGLQEDEELKMAISGSKRKRATSSSSYLEPAIVDEVTYTAHQIGRESHSHNRDAKARRNKRSLEILPSDISDVSLSQIASSPAKPSKTYERRSRYKTKEDRYELKDATAHIQAPKVKKRKKTTRPSRKEKTGSAVLHNFAADNVALDRLTLRPSTGLGLFTKGRASSPYRRGGLPDLSFSEVNFLSTHREKPLEPKLALDSSKRHRERKAADDDDEISRFFTVAKAPMTERELNNYHNNGYAFPLPPIRSPSRKLHQYHTTTNSTTTPVEIPIRPFLGFGERRPHPPVSPGLSSSYRASVSPVKPLLRRSPSIVTSYFTWPRSSNNQNSSPYKRTVSDLFRSSPGKEDREKSRFLNSLDPRKAEHRKSVPRHECIQTSAADARAATSQRLSNHQDSEETVKLHAHDHTDQGASSHNKATIVAEVPKMIPEAQTLDFVQTTQATELADSHSVPLENAVSKEENPAAEASTEEQSPRLQFAIAVHKLLDQWKDKVEIQVSLANDIQQSYTAPSLGMNTADQLSPLQSVPQKTDIQTEPISVDQHQFTEDAKKKNVPIPSPTTLVDDHCSVVRSKLIRPASIVSRGSATKSQYSWTDPRLARDRAFAHSPFEDSTYSTCRGTGSLYEQQLPRSAPFSHQDVLRNRGDEYLNFTNHLVGENGISQDFEPLYIPAHSQHTDENLADQHDLRDSVSVPFLSGTRDDYWTSVERNWPGNFEVQHDSTLEPDPRDYYEHYEDSVTSSQIPKQPYLASRLSSATIESRSVRGRAENVETLISPNRGNKFSYGCSTTQSLQSGEVEELPVGFWKPNKLY
ncbi:hypothetical protein MMC17_001264 [Xylographa soralifera]|nr:hypothetical protein [Xylographa soralifera]